MFTRARIAVYLDGCFWHSCPIHATTPIANADYWVPKLARNRERDATVTKTLRENGWTVLRFWEHETPDSICSQIIGSVRQSLDLGPKLP